MGVVGVVVVSVGVVVVSVGVVGVSAMEVRCKCDVCVMVYSQGPQSQKRL